MEWQNDADKEWGALAAQSLNPSCIYYELKINSRTVQDERNRDRVRRMTGVQGATGKAKAPDESHADVAVHGFWKWGTSAFFYMQISNLDAGSYLKQKSDKALVTAENYTK